MKRRQFIELSSLGGLGIFTANNKLYFTPSDEKGLVFLFQGDSITDGNRGRNTDPNHIMGHGYAYAIASRVGADFSESGFIFYNRGISGNKVSDLKKRWQTDTLDLKPDVLSILVGINDAAAHIKQPSEATSIEQFEAIYRDLLIETRHLNPNILLVLQLPFVYPVGNVKEKWTLWAEDILKRQTIIRNLAKEFNAILVDYSAIFEKEMKKTPVDYWIWDGIHPTVFAHELMARHWIKAVSSKLKFLKKYKNK